MSNRLELHCRDNPRCEACPIERLTDSEDRVAAGNVVALTVPRDSGNLTRIHPEMLRKAVEEVAGNLGYRSVVPEAVGAAAIVLTGLCKISNHAE